MAALEKNNKQRGEICTYVLLSKNILLCTFVKRNTICQKKYVLMFFCQKTYILSKNMFIYL